MPLEFLNLHNLQKIEKVKRSVFCEKVDRYFTACKHISHRSVQLCQFLLQLYSAGQHLCCSRAK